MSTFMEHIHRDTPPWSERTALWRPAEYDAAPSEDDGPAGAMDASPLEGHD